MNKLKSVILIDNEELDNFVNRKILENYGVTKIITFKKAIQALFYLQGTSHNYQLIIVDIYMPLIDGFEFIDKFYELNLDKKHGKICVLSASINPMDIERSNLRQIQFIDKPLTIDKLTGLEFLNLF